LISFYKPSFDFNLNSLYWTMKSVRYLTLTIFLNTKYKQKRIKF